MDIKQILKTAKEEDFFQKINLHLHTNLSDGICDFDKMVEDAIKLDMKYIAITDHNTVSGYKNSKYKDHPILIKGVEFDCILGLSLLHILGLGVDIENPELLSLCAKDKKGSSDDIYRLFKSRHPKNVINAIHKAGGIAIFAHPCCTNTINLEKFTKKLISWGLDGIETYYPYDRFRRIVKFSSRKSALKIAQDNDLLKSGGTDEHGHLMPQ